MYELIPLYHNLALRYQGLGPGTGPSQQYLGSREFLFARFAWSIFRLVQGFLDTERWVVVRSSLPQNQSSSTAGYEHKWASNASLAPRASSRSSSKRPASEIAQDAAEYLDEPDRSKRRRSLSVRRTAEDMLHSGEELNKDELFQLDESQLLIYETMRRREGRSEECLGRSSQEPREVDCVDSRSKVERWRSQTLSELDSVEGDDGVEGEDVRGRGRGIGDSPSPPLSPPPPPPPDLSFSYGSEKSSALLSDPVDPGVANHNATTDDSASKASCAVADIVHENVTT